MAATLAADTDSTQWENKHECSIDQELADTAS